MAKKFKFSCLVLLACSLLVSCGKTEPKEEVLDLGYDYFPTDSAWIKVYLVDSISFNDNTQSSDTFQFLLKESFDTHVNAAGLENHRIVIRSVQFLPSQPWEPRSSIFVLRTQNNLQQVIDNQRFIKLVFPIGQAQSWNGNALNTLGRRNFVWQNKFISHQVSDTVYAPTVTVLEAQINNLIEEVFIKSTYAKGVGLIEFTNNNLNIQTTGVSGYKVHQRLISYIHP